MTVLSKMKTRCRRFGSATGIARWGATWLALGALGIASWGCDIPRSQRCNSDEVFVYADREGAWNCLPAQTPDGTDTNDPVDADGGASDAGGPGGEDGIPSGQGLPCSQHADCNSYEADYCVTDPTAPQLGGTCVVKDCSTDPDSCRGGYRCCDFPPIGDAIYSGHNLCLPESAYLDVVTQLGSCHG